MQKISLNAKKKNYNIAFQISATHETCSMLSGRRLSYSRLSYKNKLKELDCFGPREAGDGGEGGGGVGSLYNSLTGFLLQRSKQVC